jgi:hypothetical protein
MSKDQGNRDPSPFANCNETSLVCRSKRGLSEEVGIEIGEVETVLGEVR